MPVKPDTDVRRAITARYRQAHKERINANSRRKDREQRDWVALQKAFPCVDCGGSFPPECMDFDHRPDEVKSFEISERVRYSHERLLREMAKCDLVCSNCHRVRTKKRRNEDRG